MQWPFHQVAERQTQRTQNPPPFGASGFKSVLPHQLALLFFIELRAVLTQAVRMAANPPSDSLGQFPFSAYSATLALWPGIHAVQ